MAIKRSDLSVSVAPELTHDKRLQLEGIVIAFGWDKLSGTQPRNLVEVLNQVAYEGCGQSLVGVLGLFGNIDPDCEGYVSVNMTKLMKHWNFFMRVWRR